MDVLAGTLCLPHHVLWEALWDFLKTLAFPTLNISILPPQMDRLAVFQRQAYMFSLMTSMLSLENTTNCRQILQESRDGDFLCLD